MNWSVFFYKVYQTVYANENRLIKCSYWEGVLQKNHSGKFRQVDEKVYVQEFLVAVTVTKKKQEFLVAATVTKKKQGVVVCIEYLWKAATAPNFYRAIKTL